MAVSASSGTPKGTAPCPTRRRTKHKTIAYGLCLMARHAERKARRAARVAKVTA